MKVSDFQGRIIAMLLDRFESLLILLMIHVGQIWQRSNSDQGTSTIDSLQVLKNRGDSLTPCPVRFLKRFFASFASLIMLHEKKPQKPIDLGLFDVSSSKMGICGFLRRRAFGAPKPHKTTHKAAHFGACGIAQERKFFGKFEQIFSRFWGLWIGLENGSMCLMTRLANSDLVQSGMTRQNQANQDQGFERSIRIETNPIKVRSALVLTPWDVTNLLRIVRVIGIGIVGIGFMGMIHYLAARQVPGAEVKALCSRNPKKLAGDWTGIQGNFGPPGTQMDLSGHQCYSDFEALIGDDSVQLVDLCLPNEQHADHAVRALEAGKHVLVEKPIALTDADADRMVAAAQQAGKLLMVAHVLPYFPEFAFAREAVASGRYGRLRAAHLKRVISKPDWSGDVADFASSGGPAIDLHIHDTHYIGLVCGVPQAVRSRGVFEGDVPLHLDTQYLYGEGGPAVSCLSGALSQAARAFNHGFEFYLDEATLAFEFATLGGQAHVATPLSVIRPDGQVDRPELGGGDPVDAFVAEISAAVASVESGKAAPELSGELAKQALALCHLEVQSARTGLSEATA